MSAFLPVARMRQRVDQARDESDTAMFFELMYLGEMVLKILVMELLTSLQEDRDRNVYSLEYRILRADGIGEWVSVLDEMLSGPVSQHFTQSGRVSRHALTVNIGPAEESWQRRAVMSMNRVCRSFETDYEDMSRTKISLRQWTRQFVWLRNRTRGHGAPRAAVLSDVCSSLLSSLDEVIDNAPAFSRSWAYLRRGMSGKYRVSSFAGDREEFAFLARESGYSYADGIYIFLDDAPREVRLFYTDSDLSDFFLPNGNYRKGVFETLSYITDERRTEDGASHLLPSQAQPSSETAAAPALDVVGELFSNMPPGRPEYVPRPTLEDELGGLLVDDRHPVITLQGRGGIGKTSVALEVLHRQANLGDFFAIVWFSARDIDLLPDGPRVVRADVLSIDDVARDFTSLMRPDAKFSLSDAHALFTDSLSGQADEGPFIFVFDNFETIREQAELYSYVSNAVRLPNKVLITTRTRDFKADYPIEVRGMARDEYRILVAEVSKRLKIVDVLDPDYEKQLYEDSGGHPYITKVLLGEVAHGGRQVSLKRVVAAKDAMLDALFDRSFATLSPAAQRIFLTLCSWRSLVPRLGLEAVLLRPGNERLDVERALAELIQSSLVEELPSVGGPSFLSVPLPAALFGKRKLVTSPMKIAIDADMELVRGFGATTTTDMTRGLGPRVERLARAVAERAADGADLTQEFAVLEYIASEYPPAWLSLAELQSEMGRTALAIQSVNRYLESVPDDETAWRRLITLYRNSKDGLGEMHARLQLAELGHAPFYELSSSASRLVGLLYRREIELDADERRLMVRKFRDHMETRQEEADATDLSRLAWLCIYDQDTEAADKWAAKGLLMEPGNEYCLKIKTRLNEVS